MGRFKVVFAKQNKFKEGRFSIIVRLYKYASTILYMATLYGKKSALCVFGKSTMGRECCIDCGKTVCSSYFHLYLDMQYVK